MNYFLVTIHSSPSTARANPYHRYLTDTPSLAAYLINRPGETLINSHPLTPGEEMDLHAMGFQRLPRVIKSVRGYDPPV